MQHTPDERVQAARTSLFAADRWAEKGDTRQELSCRETAAVAFLSAAVGRCEDAEQGTAYLGDIGMPLLVGRIAELNDFFHAALRQQSKPTAGAVSTAPTAIHLAWLLGEWETAWRLLAPANDPLVRKFFPSTPFWAEYNRALACLDAGTPYLPVLPKLRGYERYWAPYLNLICDLTHDTDPSTANDVIRTSFEKRNQDRKLTDCEMIDGDAFYPVRWDFRASSIESFWRAASRSRAESGVSSSVR